MTEPVRLTPAWEDNNLTDDELNFKVYKNMFQIFFVQWSYKTFLFCLFQSLTMEQANLELNPPKDRFNIVYFTLLLHGIGVLMPWNMFITAKSVNINAMLYKILPTAAKQWRFNFFFFFQYFIDYKMSKEYTGIDSEYRTYFLSYMMIASQVPNLVFNWLNVFIQIG